MAGRYAKLASDFHSNPKAIAAGLLGRAVYLFVLCQNATDSIDGRVKIGYVGPSYLARQLDITPEEASAGFDACVASGLLRVDGKYVVIVGWDDDEWGVPTSTPRVQAFRARHRNASNNETARNVSDNSETHETPSRTIRTSRASREKRSAESSPPPAPPSPSDHEEFFAEGTSPGGAKPAKPPRAPSGDHQQFIAEFEALYIAANGGARPSWGKKQGSWVRELLKRPGGLEDAVRRARNMFTAPPDWPPPPHDLGTLIAHFDKFAQPSAGGARTSPTRYQQVTGHETYPDGEVKL